MHCESRLAFEAGNQLLASGVPAAKINGGYAFDGWHLYETQVGSVPVRPLPPWWDQRTWDYVEWLRSPNSPLGLPHSAWWSGPVRPPGVVDYLITVSPLVRASPRVTESFSELRRLAYQSGWSGKVKFVFVLKREPTVDAVIPQTSAEHSP